MIQHPSLIAHKISCKSNSTGWQGAWKLNRGSIYHLNIEKQTENPG